MSAGELQPAENSLQWSEIVEHCSRLHTTRRRPEGPWSDAAMREDAHALDVVVRGLKARIVPTRLHEPGFYWWQGDEPMRSPGKIDQLRDAVEAGEVYPLISEKDPSNE